MSVYKQVSREEFRNFLDAYKGRLEHDCVTVCEPVCHNYYDFSKAVSVIGTSEALEESRQAYCIYEDDGKDEFYIRCKDLQAAFDESRQLQPDDIVGTWCRPQVLMDGDGTVPLPARDATFRERLRWFFTGIPWERKQPPTSSGLRRREFLAASIAQIALLAVGVRRARAGFGPFARGAGAAASGGNGFYADPFSTYTSYIADTTFAGTNGTPTTVSWNGGSLTAPTYGPDANGTFQPAIDAAGAVNGGAGQRVCVLAGQTWTHIGGSGHQFPALTTTSTNRCVVQGDPAASPTTMPKITRGITTAFGYGSAGFWLGGYYNGSGITGVANAHVTIRKLEITNFVNDNGAYGIVCYGNGGTENYDDLVVEYCNIHLFRAASGSSGEIGPFIVANAGDTTVSEVRYCKLYDSSLTSGAANQNFSCIGLYGGQVYAHHNEGYLAYNFCRLKAVPAVVPNNIRVEKNYIHDCLVGVSTASGGETVAPNGYDVIGNLFGWENLNNAVYSGASAFSDFGVDAASPSTPIGGSMVFDHNTISADWTNGSSGACIFNKRSQTQTLTNNIILASTPLWTSDTNDGGTFTQIDYNAYFAGNWGRNNNGTNTRTETTWAGWQSTYTNYPSIGDISGNPDTHGLYIPNLSPGTIAGQFPGYASNNYALVNGSLMLTSDSTGGRMGYDPNDCGPGW